jgi:hypothetical protein
MDYVKTILIDVSYFNYWIDSLMYLHPSDPIKLSLY